MTDAAETVGSLGALLDQELAFDATTSSRLSSHLPMALVALHELGADDTRLTAFADLYRGRLAPVPDAAPLATFDEWLAARGRHGTYGAHRAYLEGQVAAIGVDATVRRHVEHLVDGLSGAAFHGIIRLAYSLESQSDARVAAGLAYLSEVHQPLGPRTGAAPRTTDPFAALRDVAACHELGVVGTSGNIGQRMRAVADHAEFRGVVDWLEVSDATPSALTDAAVALYAQTDDFTALHGMTGSHAVSVVSSYVEDTDSLAAWWFQALAAAYVTIGAPAIEDAAVPLAPWLAHPSDWDEIAAAAVTSDDEHVVKLVYSARVLHAAAGDPLCRAVAARQAGMRPAAEL